jgi:hypothetical protein
LGLKQNKKGLAAILIALIVIAVVLIVVGAVFAFIIFYWSTGNPTTREYTNTGFTSIDVGSAFQVDVKQADTFSIKITAGERVFDRITVTQDGDTLKIDVTPGLPFFGVFDTKAEITMPTMEAVTLSGATSGKMDGFSSDSQFTAKISGASSLDMTSIAVGDLTVELSGASRLTGQGTGGNLVSEVSGASNMELENFQVNDVNVNLSGASHAVVNPTGTLNVDASGASSLQYVGNPTLGTVNTSGASTVNRK